MKQTILAILIAATTLTSCTKSEDGIIQVKVTNVNSHYSNGPYGPTGGWGIVTLDKPLSGKRNYLISDLQKEDPNFKGLVGQKLNISRYFWNYKQYNP